MRSKNSITPPVYVTPANIHTNLILNESILINLPFAADSLRLASLNFFSGELHKTILFRHNRRRGRFGRSRASKVTNIGANRKRTCDFLLVRNSNHNPILHCFGDLPTTTRPFRRV